MSSSLRQKYTDRFARIGQFFAFWAILAIVFFYLFGRILGGDYFFDVAKFWLLNSVSPNIPAWFHGQRYHVGDLLQWAAYAYPDSLHKVLLSLWLASVGGLTVTIAIFVYFIKKGKTKPRTEHVRGARLVAQKELKKELEK